MLHVEIKNHRGEVKSIQVPPDSVIGKSAQSEIFLEGWRVGKEHARLFKTPAGILIEDMGTFGGTLVNGEKIIQHGPLRETDEIQIGPYMLKIKELGHNASAMVQAAHPRSRSETAPVRNKMATESLQSSRLHAIQAAQAARGDAEPASATPGTALVVAFDARQRQVEFEWRKRLHGQLLTTIDLRRRDVSRMSDDVLRAETEKLIRELMLELDLEIPNGLDRELLCKQVLDEAIGLGPLEELLEDDSITEIMVNRFDEIYVEKAGRLQKHPLAFTTDRAVMGVIERIVAPIGRRIDESSPMVDARLKDGSRVNAIIPPLALKGATLTIRKFPKRKLSVEDLVNFGSVSHDMAEFLRVCVEQRKNIIVSGGTGSGKTTLLNILSNFIPDGERIITIEDAAELRLHHAHLVSLESRPSNAEGRGAVPIRELVKNSLRMRPDRIVVGECRGAEALDMLQAMNTGHEGSLTTLHANTPRDALARLETLILMAGMDLPLTAIREQIASAVDIIVQQTRFSCGTRKVTHIVELTGMETGKIQLQELFKYQSQGYVADGKIDGDFTGCNMVPSFYEDLIATGNALDIDIFKPLSADGMADLGDLE
jgi:pilus assembly protein CpaF